MTNLFKEAGNGANYYFSVPVNSRECVQVNITGTREVFEHGAEKHQDAGFETGVVPISSHFYAALRHLWRWFLRIEKDKETKRSHLHHAHCRILMMIYQEQLGLNDDR